MAVVSKRVAAHVIRKPVVEAIPEAVPEMQAAHETTRVDIRELQHMLTSTAPPVDLETDIEVCAEPSEPASVARSTRLAHTVRRAESIAEASDLEPAPTASVREVARDARDPREVAPAATVEMQAIQIEAAHAAAELELDPIAASEEPPASMRVPKTLSAEPPEPERSSLAAPGRRDRATLYAAAAFVVAAISLVVVVASM